MIFNLKLKTSTYVWGIISIIICYQVFSEPIPNPFTWDLFGYYVYLPATFIYNDIDISDISIYEQLHQKYFISDTFYQLYSYNDDGRIMTRYPIGLAIMFSPFFFIGHWIAAIMGYPQDGFSAPYVYSVTIGAVMYIIGSIWILKKILLTYFKDYIVAITLLCLVFGTNYWARITLSTVDPHNLLFFLYASVILATIKWHKNSSIINTILLGGSLGLLIATRQTEIIACAIPVLWGLKNIKKFPIHIFKIIREKYKMIILAILLASFPIVLQMLYWHALTDSFVVYSYSNNHGEGLNLSSPFIFEVLFSYRKGWVLYTPLTIFGIIGFYFLYRKDKQTFLAITVVFILFFYLASAWNNWWYAGSFGQRSMIQSYPLIMIPFAAFLSATLRIGRLKWFIYCIILGGVGLNIFQTWQYKRGILPLDRITKAYYWDVFGQTTSPTQEQNDKLSYNFNLSFEESNKKYHYENDTVYMKSYGNENLNDTLVSNNDSNWLAIDKGVEFNGIVDLNYKELIENYAHVWLEVSCEVSSENFHQTKPILVTTMKYKDKNYAYKAIEFNRDTLVDNEWYTLKSLFLLPEIVRTKNDLFQTYLWIPQNEVDLKIRNVIIKRFYQPIEKK